MIMNGDVDQYPEAAFNLVGTIEEAIEKGENDHEAKSIMILEIITPENELYNGTVRSVKVPGRLEEFEILNNHASIVSSLINGNIRVINDEQEELNFNIKSKN